MKCAKKGARVEVRVGLGRYRARLVGPNRHGHFPADFYAVQTRAGKWERTYFKRGSVVAKDIVRCLPR